VVALRNRFGFTRDRLHNEIRLLLGEIKE
jgi:hypothetical protein